MSSWLPVLRSSAIRQRRVGRPRHHYPVCPLVPRDQVSAVECLKHNVVDPEKLHVPPVDLLAIFEPKNK
eukprot:CAMPEP_0182547596 /NCGR_PEP_ID=MMETSP1323-20130603/37666_1 /TAXON_ID=236787 /ORGANISM="Florenciella parvula, Strain RCC1693" /LENGTH=68 /DNA_ID=CAMNT_0024758915 /DNA_START=87 /DNA_END=293 /DNA_ORIENTATION=+